ncbi:MAG: head GIN domain-containing protein [Bacteroidia bacterium]
MTFLSNIKNYIVLVSCLTCFVFSACSLDCIDVEGTGSIVEKSIDTESFNSIENDIPATIKINQGEALSLTVSGHSNITDLIEFDVKSNKLTIRFKENCVNTNYDSLSINITLPSLVLLNVNGSGEAIIENGFQCKNLELGISGSGNIKASVEASKALEATISGSGVIKLIGITESATFNISGSGEIHAYDFQTIHTSVSISGSGDAEVIADKSLKTNISGSGNIQYKGNPEITSTISGSGSLIKVK